MNRLSGTVSFALLALAAGCAHGPASHPSDDTFVLIVNARNTESDMSMDAVRSVYMGRRHTWTDGTKAVALDTAGNAAHRQAFFAKVLKMSPEDFNRHEVSQAYSEAGHLLNRLKDDGEVIRFVAKEAGAIGFVAKASLAAGAPGSVRLIPVP